jgi:hypothetical protein
MISLIDAAVSIMDDDRVLIPLRPGIDESFPDETAKAVLNDAVNVLLGNRDETFECERAIRFFQLQGWIFYPTIDVMRLAGLIAATKIARTIEEDEYVPVRNGIAHMDELPIITLERMIELRLKNPTYWNVYNNIIAPYGGLAALLETGTPHVFDWVMDKQLPKAKVVADLVEYRLRYALHGQGSANGANLNHAMFFYWWPTHALAGKRGVRAEGKCPHPKTMSAMWSSLKESTIFIYLQERHGFLLSPPRAVVEADRFVGEISSHARDLTEMRRLFGAYAYIAEAIQQITGEQPYITIPQELPRVPIVVPAFSDAERQTMSEYEEYHLDMWQ